MSLKKLLKGKKLTLTSCEHHPFPIPFFTTRFPSPEKAIPAQSSQCLLQGARLLPRATIPARPPEEQASQHEWDWRAALNSPTYNTPPLLLTVSPAGTEVPISFLIDSTPGSLFLVIPAGRV